MDSGPGVKSTAVAGEGSHAVVTVPVKFGGRLPLLMREHRGPRDSKAPHVPHRCRAISWHFAGVRRVD